VQAPRLAFGLILVATVWLWIEQSRGVPGDGAIPARNVVHSDSPADVLLTNAAPRERVAHQDRLQGESSVQNQALD